MSTRTFTATGPVTGIPLPCEAYIHVDSRGKLTVQATDLHRPGELETLLRAALTELEEAHRASLNQG